MSQGWVYTSKCKKDSRGGAALEVEGNAELVGGRSVVLSVLLAPTKMPRRRNKQHNKTASQATKSDLQKTGQRTEKERAEVEVELRGGMDKVSSTREGCFFPVDHADSTNFRMDTCTLMASQNPPRMRMKR